jgi:hypothetical protein
MAHKTVQFIIGQILTDEGLRARFLERPIETLTSMRERGFDLTNIEITALALTNRRFWDAGAGWIDPHLRRAYFRDADRAH